jgi:hypothetical protein
MPRCAHPERLGPFIRGASILLAAVPENSATKINAAVRLWNHALDFFGVLPDDVDFTIPIAIIVARACPPVGVEIPGCFGPRPVLPTTAAGDVDNLRRAAREHFSGMERFRVALYDDRVSALLRNIGARVHKLRTDKRALTFGRVAAFVEPTLTAAEAGCARPDDVRDAFALVLGVCFGTRVSELVGLDGQHVNPVGLDNDSDVIRVTFTHTKTRQSLLRTHQPWENVSAHPLLLRAFDAFNGVVGFTDDFPVFHCTARAHAGRRLSTDWFAKLVKRVDPACVAHSVRVALATELWAAGASLTDIMAAGRWASAAAVLYIVGSLDRQVSASKSLGSAGVRYTAAGLRQQIGTAGLPDWRTLSAADAADRWGAHLQAIEASDGLAS